MGLTDYKLKEYIESPAYSDLVVDYKCLGVASVWKEEAFDYMRVYLERGIRANIIGRDSKGVIRHYSLAEALDNPDVFNKKSEVLIVVTGAELDKFEEDLPLLVRENYVLPLTSVTNTKWTNGYENMLRKGNPPMGRITEL